MKRVADLGLLNNEVGSHLMGLGPLKLVGPKLNARPTKGKPSFSLANQGGG